MQKWQIELYSTPSWLLQTLLMVAAASAVILFLARENALRAGVCLYPAAVSDAEKRGQSIAADYGDDCAAADRSAAECIEYLYVQRALRLDAGFERLRVLDVCSDERGRGVGAGV